MAKSGVHMCGVVRHTHTVIHIQSSALIERQARRIMFLATETPVALGIPNQTLSVDRFIEQRVSCKLNVTNEYDKNIIVCFRTPMTIPSLYVCNWIIYQFLFLYTFGTFPSFLKQFIRIFVAAKFDEKLCNSDAIIIFSFGFATKFPQIVACDVKLSNAFRVAVCVCWTEAHVYKNNCDTPGLSESDSLTLLLPSID